MSVLHPPLLSSVPLLFTGKGGTRGNLFLILTRSKKQKQKRNTSIEKRFPSISATASLNVKGLTRNLENGKTFRRDGFAFRFCVVRVVVEYAVKLRLLFAVFNLKKTSGDENEIDTNICTVRSQIIITKFNSAEKGITPAKGQHSAGGRIIIINNLARLDVWRSFSSLRANSFRLRGPCLDFFLRANGGHCRTRTRHMQGLPRQQVGGDSFCFWLCACVQEDKNAGEYGLNSNALGIHKH